MKAVLMSIQPKWCELIANGKKAVEVRKTKPKLETPFKVYIYCTQGIVWADYRSSVKAGRGKVIGEFICNEITVADYGYYCVLPKSKTMLDELDLLEYANEKTVYGWHISDLVIYDTPKELWEFRHYKKFDWWDYGHHTNKPQWELCSLTRPPQSWCYVERSDNNGE